MEASKTYGELVKMIVALPKLNTEGRQQVRDAAGLVADELIRGLQLGVQRLRGVETIVRTTSPGKVRDTELLKYLDESQGKLFDAFAEFKICRSLRATRAQFKEWFGLPRWASSIGKGDTVQQLLADLENDERMIIDEIGPIWDDLRTQVGASDKKLLSLIRKHVEGLQKRENRIRKLARDVHDKM